MLIFDGHIHIRIHTGTTADCKGLTSRRQLTSMERTKF